jgi:hypothetical protein
MGKCMGVLKLGPESLPKALLRETVLVRYQQEALHEEREDRFSAKSLGDWDTSRGHDVTVN